jgi:hypothetical protein
MLPGVAIWLVCELLSGEPGIKMNAATAIAMQRNAAIKLPQGLRRVVLCAAIGHLPARVVTTWETRSYTARSPRVLQRFCNVYTRPGASFSPNCDMDHSCPWSWSAEAISLVVHGWLEHADVGQVAVFLCVV